MRYSRKQQSYQSRLLVILGSCILTLLVMGSYELLPARIVEIKPANVPRYLYSQEDSNSSVAEWSNYEKSEWRCYVTNTLVNGSCGFSISLDHLYGEKGINLSKFKRIELALGYKGPEKYLRIYLRNIEDGFTDLLDVRTAKFNNVLIPVDSFNEMVQINFSDFSVAEWWVKNFSVPRKLAAPNFNQVIVFGIDLNAPPAIGVHSFELKKLRFVGEWVSREAWYLGIICLWLGVIFVGGAIGLVRLRREVQLEHIRLSRLKSQHVSLVQETIHYKKLSTIDNLTGLLNRHGLSEFIETFQAKDDASGFSMMVLDIDFFKRINDAHGHDVGDIVLKGVAQAIIDVVGEDRIISRWGGEEFVIVLPRVNIVAAKLLAENLRARTASLDFNLPNNQGVTISIGVGSSNSNREFTDLFKTVDLALYQAKAMGRNRVVEASL